MLNPIVAKAPKARLVDWNKSDEPDCTDAT